MKFSPGDLIIRKDLEYPEGALSFDGYMADGGLRAHPMGGGFEIMIPAQDARRFRAVTEDERGANLFRRATFVLEGVEGEFEGWTNGEEWNGWAMPRFEKKEAERLLTAMPEWLGRHDEQRDVFVTVSQDDEEEIWEAERIRISDGTGVRVYGIGAGSWIWEEVN